MAELFKYSASATLYFPLVAAGTAVFTTAASASLTGTNVMISKDAGAFAATTASGSGEGAGWYSLVLDPTELNAKQVVVTIGGPTGSLGTVIESQGIIIHTFGHADAMYPFDFSVGTQSVNVTEIKGTAANGTQGILGINVVNWSGTVAEGSGGAVGLTTAGAAVVWDRVLTGATHNIVNSAGRRLRQIDAAFEVHDGTAQAGGATSITLDAGASDTDDIYSGDRIIITEGDGAQEHGIVRSYDGTTKVALMAESWVITPNSTSVFEIVPADVDVETWQHTVVTVANALPSVNVGTMSNNAISSAAFTSTALISQTVGTATTALGTVSANVLSWSGTVVSGSAGFPVVSSINGLSTATLGTVSTALGTISANVVSVNGSATAATAIAKAANAYEIVTATAGTLNTTAMSVKTADATDDHYNGRTIIWLDGSLLRQSVLITDYVGADKTFFFTGSSTETPADGVVAIVV